MNRTLLASIAMNWTQRLLGMAQARTEPEARTEDDTYGQPVVVVNDDHVEVRLHGDVIPHAYAYYFNPGEAVSDVGFLAALDSIPADSHIVVSINSLGGDVFGGTVIANALARRKAETRVDGIAASIASVILAAGSKAHISRGATVMVHKPWSYASGNAPGLRAEADVLDKVEEAMLDIYVSKSGAKYSREQWRAALAGPAGADGTWMTGDEAVTAGIADTYEQPEAKPEPKRAAQLLEQRKVAASLYCSTLPKHLAEVSTDTSTGSPKAPALGGSEAKREPRASARRPGVSYLK